MKLYVVLFSILSSVGFIEASEHSKKEKNQGFKKVSGKEFVKINGRNRRTLVYYQNRIKKQKNSNIQNENSPYLKRLATKYKIFNNPK